MMNGNNQGNYGSDFKSEKTENEKKEGLFVFIIQVKDKSQQGKRGPENKRKSGTPKKRDVMNGRGGIQKGRQK